MIQLQNNQYRKCLILHPKDKESEKELEERLNKIRKKLSECLWQEFEGDEKLNSFGKFFKYKYEQIKDNMTVDDILNQVVVDLKKICDNLSLLMDIK